MAPSSGISIVGVLCPEGLLRAPGSVTPGISGRSAPVLSPSPLKRLIEDFFEVWGRVRTGLPHEVGHSEKAAPGPCPPFPSGETGPSESLGIEMGHPGETGGQVPSPASLPVQSG